MQLRRGVALPAQFGIAAGIADPPGDLPGLMREPGGLLALAAHRVRLGQTGRHPTVDAGLLGRQQLSGPFVRRQHEIRPLLHVVEHAEGGPHVDLGGDRATGLEQHQRPFERDLRLRVAPHVP